MSSIKEILERICHDEEISSRELAKKAGLSKETINKLMRGEGNPNIFTFRKISKAFGIPVEALKDEESEEKSDEVINTIYAKIKVFCKKQNITVKEFSAKIGVSLYTIRHLDDKGVKTRKSTFECIANAMNITAQELMNLEK